MKKIILRNSRFGINLLILLLFNAYSIEGQRGNEQTSLEQRTLTRCKAMRQLDINEKIHKNHQDDLSQCEIKEYNLTDLDFDMPGCKQPVTVIETKCDTFELLDGEPYYPKKGELLRVWSGKFFVILYYNNLRITNEN